MEGIYETRMGITAENVATRYGITREDSDRFALRSQQRYQHAWNEGKFQQEIVPIQIDSKTRKTFTTEEDGLLKNMLIVDRDEHPRPNTSLEQLSKLPPVFKKDGIVTAGNASGINDGAAALVLASELALNRHSLRPLAKVVDYGVAGVDPEYMGKFLPNKNF